MRVPDRPQCSDQQPSIQEGRVLLRPWSSADIEPVFAACQDDEIQRSTMVPRPYAREHARQFIDDLAPRSWESGDGALFALVDTEASELAGSVGVLQFHEGVAALGYWTVPHARGLGLMTTAVRLLTAWCIRSRGTARVELSIEDANLPSRRVAVSAGFTEEGILRQRMVLHGRRINIVMYSLLAVELPPD